MEARENMICLKRLELYFKNFKMQSVVTKTYISLY